MESTSGVSSNFGISKSYLHHFLFMEPWIELEQLAPFSYEISLAPTCQTRFSAIRPIQAHSFGVGLS